MYEMPVEQHSHIRIITTTDVLKFFILSFTAGGERIVQVFEQRLTTSIRSLDFGKMLASDNVKKVVEEADGYQPHLVAPEMGYRRLLQECLILFKVSGVDTRVRHRKWTP